MNREEKIAELTGAIIGDGHIAKNGKQIELVGHPIKDKEYLYTIGSFGNEIFNLAFKKTVRERALRIIFNSKKMNDYFVNEIGIPRGKKSDIVEIPEVYINSPYLKNVIRGIFDTDGYLFYDKRELYTKPYPRIGIHMQSKKLVSQINEIFKNMDFKTYTLDRKNSMTLELYGEKQLKKYMNEIGFLNKKHLSKLQ